MIVRLVERGLIESHGFLAEFKHGQARRGSSAVAQEPGGRIWSSTETIDAP